MSGVDFSGKGSSGVDLRWYFPKEFKALSNEQSDEFTQWQSSLDGRKILDNSKKEAAGKCRKRDEGKKRGSNKGKKVDGRKIMKRAIKTPNGLRTVTALLGAEKL